MVKAAMSPTQLKDCLSCLDKDHGFLHNLDPHYVQKLEALALEAFFVPDQVIFHEGDANGYFYLIVSGSVVLEILGPAGHVEIQTLRAGDAMGWSSLLNTSRKHFQARALTRVTAAALDAAELRRLCEQEPRFGYAIMKRLLEVVTERLYASRLLIEKAAAG